MSTKDLITLVEQYKEAQQLREAAEAEMDALKEQIKAEMAARGASKMDVGTHKVTVSTYTTSRLDSKALKAAAPDLVAKFTKTTTAQRFVIA